MACAGFMRARAHTTLLHTPLEGSNNTTCLSDLSWTVIWPGALTSRPGEIILGASLADPYLLLHRTELRLFVYAELDPDPEPDSGVFWIRI